MLIKSIKLFNFCQFSKLELDMEPGTTRVYAPNGAGKTNFLRGIVYALTGWFDPSWGNQSDLQKDGTANPGFAEVTFEHDQSVYKIRRYALAGTKTPDQLSDTSGKVILEKRQRINAWLEERLPVNLTVLAQLMWLRQENSSWLLSATAASINTFLAVIFDTKKLERIRDALKRVTDTVAVIRGDQKEKIEHWKGVLEQLPDIEGLEKDIEIYNQEYIKLASYSGKTIMLEKQWQKKLESVQSLISVKTEELKKVSDDIKSTVEALKVHEGNRSLRQIDEAYYEVVAKLSTACCKTKDLEEALAEKSVLLERLANIETKSCAFCGSHLKDSQMYKNKVANKLTGIDSYEDALTAVQEARKEAEAAIENNAQEIQNLSELQKQLEEERKRAEYADELNKRKEGLVKRRDELERENGNAKQDEESLKQAIVIKEGEQDIGARLKEVQECLSTMSQMLSDAKANKQLAENSIQQLEEELEQHDRNAFVRKLFITMRDVLSQSRAQARYISGKLEQFNSKVSHYLALSEMPFVLQLDPEQHIFNYHMVDSDVMHPAGMLSGAQKAAASIAIQMALIETAYPQLPLLLVDEADAALSPENKHIAARLYALLGKTHNESVFIVSQSEEVDEACDRTWQLQST